MSPHNHHFIRHPGHAGDKTRPSWKPMMTGALRKGTGGKEHAYHTLRCLNECWALGCKEVVMTSQCGLLMEFTASVHVSVLA